MARILIIEDQKEVREFAINFFQKYNIETMGAESGEEAIILLKSYQPDLIILDIALPGIDGIETLKLIKEFNPQIKVIMVTAKSPHEDNVFKKSQELGASAYIHKPLELDELKEIVLKELNLK